MWSVFRTSQILIFLFTFLLVFEATSETTSKATRDLIIETHFEILAEQLRSETGAEQIVSGMKKRFSSEDDAKFLNAFAQASLKVKEARVVASGLVVVTNDGKKLESGWRKNRVTLNAKPIEIAATAKQFFARVESLLATSKISKRELIVPPANAIGPVPLLAGAAMVYAGSEIFEALYPQSLESYFAEQTKTCERERKANREYDGSKTSITLKVMAQKNLIDEKAFHPGKGCDKEGELRKTCEASLKYFSCIRDFKKEQGAGAASSNSRRTSR